MESDPQGCARCLGATPALPGEGERLVGWALVGASALVWILPLAAALGAVALFGGDPVRSLLVAVGAFAATATLAAAGLRAWRRARRRADR